MGRVTGLSGSFESERAVGVSSQLALLDENRGVGCDGDVSSRISLLRVSIFRYATFKRPTNLSSFP